MSLAAQREYAYALEGIGPVEENRGPRRWLLFPGSVSYEAKVVFKNVYVAEEKVISFSISDQKREGLEQKEKLIKDFDEATSQLRNLEPGQVVLVADEIKRKRQRIRRDLEKQGVSLPLKI